MAEEHDLRLRLFFFAQDAIVVAIEQVNDLVVGRVAMAVFEDLYVGVRSEALAHALSEQHRLLMRIVVPDEAADKSDENQ